MMLKSLKPAFLLALLVSIVPALAQADNCPAIVQTVLTKVGTICEPASRNQACYGNVSMEVQPRAGMTDLKFQQIGDIADVTAIQSLRLSPMDQANNLWGVALMRLQANLPDTIPGQNVTFLLFGDTEIASAVSASNTTASPMQAFYLRTGIGDAACAEAPQSGLMVQTPKGAGQVTFAVNGVNVSMASTVFFQAKPGDKMRIATLNGTAGIVYRDRVYPVIRGTQLVFPIDDDLNPAGDPEIEAYDADEMSMLPIGLLDEDIDIAPPLTDEELQLLIERFEAGEPICGDAFFPSCDEVPHILGGAVCSLGDDGVTFVCDDGFDFYWGEAGFGDESYAELESETNDQNTGTDKGEVEGNENSDDNSGGDSISTDDSTAAEGNGSKTDNTGGGDHGESGNGDGDS